MHFLKEYTRHFSGALTYPSDVGQGWGRVVKEGVLGRPEEVTNEKQLIQEINYLRITWAVEYPKPTLESVESIFKAVRELYPTRVK